MLIKIITVNQSSNPDLKINKQYTHWEKSIVCNSFTVGYSFINLNWKTLNFISTCPIIKTLLFFSELELIGFVMRIQVEMF